MISKIKLIPLLSILKEAEQIKFVESKKLEKADLERKKSIKHVHTRTSLRKK